MGERCVTVTIPLDISVAAAQLKVDLENVIPTNVEDEANVLVIADDAKAVADGENSLVESDPGHPLRVRRSTQVSDFIYS